MRETPELTVIHSVSALSPLRTVFHKPVESYSHQILIDLALNRSIKNTSFTHNQVVPRKTHPRIHQGLGLVVRYMGGASMRQRGSALHPRQTGNADILLGHLCQAS